MPMKNKKNSENRIYMIHRNDPEQIEKLGNPRVIGIPAVF